MIDNIFEFNNITAEDVMVHRTDMVVVWIDDSTEDIVERIRQTGRSRDPVCGEDIDDILGLLLARDFLLNAQSSRAVLHARKIVFLGKAHKVDHIAAVLGRVDKGSRSPPPHQNSLGYQLLNGPAQGDPAD